MFIYQMIGMLVCLPLLTTKSKSKIKLKKSNLSLLEFCIILLVIFMFLISVFRYNIGTDYHIYQNRFDKDDFSKLEWLNVSLIWLIKAIGGEFHLYLVITEIIVFAILGFAIIKFVPDQNKIWSLIIFVLFNYYGASFNYIRQFPAITLTLISIYYLSKANKKNKIYFLYSLIFYILAFGFHSSCLFSLPFFFVAKIGLFNRKTVVAFSVIFTILYIINPIDFINDATLYIMNNFTGRWASGTINTTDASWAARLYNSGASLVDRVLYFPFIFLTTQIFRDKKYKMTSLQRLILSIFYAYNLLMALNVGSEMIDRVLLYISIYNIFAIPYLFSYVRFRYGSSWSSLFKVGMLAIGVFILLRELNGNVYEIVPYISILNWF